MAGLNEGQEVRSASSAASEGSVERRASSESSQGGWVDEMVQLSSRLSTQISSRLSTQVKGLMTVSQWAIEEDGTAPLAGSHNAAASAVVPAAETPRPPVAEVTPPPPAVTPPAEGAASAPSAAVFGRIAKERFQRIKESLLHEALEAATAQELERIEMALNRSDTAPRAQTRPRTVVGRAGRSIVRAVGAACASLFDTLLTEAEQFDPQLELVHEHFSTRAQPCMQLCCPCLTHVAS